MLVAMMLQFRSGHAPPRSLFCHANNTNTVTIVVVAIVVAAAVATSSRRRGGDYLSGWILADHTLQYPGLGTRCSTDSIRSIYISRLLHFRLAKLGEVVSRYLSRFLRLLVPWPPPGHVGLMYACMGFLLLFAACVYQKRQAGI
jgi:hypothetical protein